MTVTQTTTSTNFMTNKTWKNQGPDLTADDIIKKLLTSANLFSFQNVPITA